MRQGTPSREGRTAGLMEEPTIVVGGTGDAHFASMGEARPGVAVVWSRDGRGPPGEGAPGDLIELGRDAFSRFVLARDPAGGTLVVEIQRDVVEPEAFPVSWGAATNPVLESIWRRVTLHAAAVAGETGEVPSLGFEPHRPLLVCRERGVAFQPPSPVTGRLDALRDCRDEELLAAAALPSWAGTARRFLVDAIAVRTTSRPQYYTASEELPRGTTASVGAWDRFVRDLGYMAVPDAARQAAAQALRDRFPCVSCTEAPRCFPRSGVGVPGQPGRGARRLTPLGLHPFRAVAHPRERVDFAEHCDLLGGAPWAAFRARHAKHWIAPGLRNARESLQDSDVFRRSRAPTPLQALLAKLALFEEVVERVAAYHRMHGQPHLALAPETVVSVSEIPGPDERWGVALRGAVRGVMLRDVMDAPPGPPIWLPPPGPARPYAHDDVCQAAEPIGKAVPDGGDIHRDGFRHARRTPVRVTAGRVWEDAERGTVECELDLTGLPLGATEVHETDRVRVVLQGAGWEGVTLWCRPDFERSAQGAFTLRAFPVRLTSAQVLDLRAAATGRALFGTGAVYRTYGAAYDLHALGMLLARAVLDNSRNGMDRIVADALPSVVSLTRAVRSRDPQEAWHEVCRVIGDVATSAPLDAFIGPDAVCYLPGETAAQGGRVPPGLWAEVLATIAACTTIGAPASFCGGTRVELDRNAFCAPVEALLSRIRDIRSRLVSIPAEPDAMGETSDAIVEDLRDLRIQQLERELTSALAKIERLQSELGTLSRPREPEPVSTPVAPPAGAAQAERAWRELYEAVLGGRTGAVPAPDPESPPFELVRSLAVGGLRTASSLLSALGELGGEEFALEQRSLERTVRQALQAAADESPVQAQRLEEATAALRSLPQTLGTSIGMLVEAHGKSAVDGSRQLLLTLSYAMRKELDLSRAQQRGLADIMSRMNDGLAELVARLYDPIFQRHVQERLRAGRRHS